MRKLGMALRSRVVQSVLGAVIMVSLGAGWVTLSTLTSASSNVVTTDGTNQQAAATSTAAPTATVDTFPTPTATPIRHVRPTATPTSNGIIRRSGTITSIDPNAHTFGLSSGVMIVTDANTTYSGRAAHFSDLRVGWQVSASCTITGSGTYLASHINADN